MVLIACWGITDIYDDLFYFSFCKLYHALTSTFITYTGRRFSTTPKTILTVFPMYELFPKTTTLTSKCLKAKHLVSNIGCSCTYFDA